MPSFRLERPQRLSTLSYDLQVWLDQPQSWRSSWRTNRTSRSSQTYGDGPKSPSVRTGTLSPRSPTQYGPPGTPGSPMPIFSTMVVDPPEMQQVNRGLPDLPEEEPRAPEPAHTRGHSQGLGIHVDGQPVGQIVQDAEAQVSGPKKRIRFFWHGPKWEGLRKKLLIVFLSGLCLVVTLSSYVGLSVTHSNLTQQFHVILILVILTTTLIFCHTLVKLCITLTTRSNSRFGDLANRMSAIAAEQRHGYANPRNPIRINFIPDDDDGTDVFSAEAKAAPPPAYGLWRQSVRVNPDAFFWAPRPSSEIREEAEEEERVRELRREERRLRRQTLQMQPLERSDSQGSTASSRTGTAAPRASLESTTTITTVRRPPSYLSDDGVAYVIEAQPTTRPPEPELPPHPSERGRLPPTFRASP